VKHGDTFLRVVTVAVVCAAAAWSLAPVGPALAGWDPSYFATTWSLWRDGGLVALLIAAALLVLSRGRIVAVLAALWGRFLAIPDRYLVAAAAVVLALFSAGAAVCLFAGNPRNVDGFAQLFQARIFQSGRLWAVPPAEVANFATLQMIVGPDKWYAQYPPGQSLVLAAGLAMGAWWLLNPLLAAALVLATWRVARWACGDASARLALVLLCTSPFVVAMAGSEMSHLAAAVFGMSAAAAATLAGQGPGRAGILAGALLGVMAAFRPLDAAAAAVPVAAILLLGSRHRTGSLLAAALGGVLLSFPTLWFNRATTGGWLEFGYTRLWGPEHSLGFHDVPWGVPLTPARAVGLTGVDLHQLNAYLLDWPVPVLALAAVGIAAGARRLAARDVVPVLGAAALFALLFFYWHRDVFYGPRLHFSAVPWVTILVARGTFLLGQLRRPVAGGLPSGSIAGTVVACAALTGAVMLTPGRLAAYRDSAPVFSLHPDREARAAGLTNALVVIPDGWATRLIVRMWAQGISVPKSSRLYPALDACTLHEALGRAERDTSSRRRLESELDSLAALGRPGVRTGLTLDPNLRLPGAEGLTAACRDELEFDRAGFLAYAPFLYLNPADLDGEVVWARDMGRGNAALFERYGAQGRTIYRWAPERPGERPVFRRLER
jgi:hypothetical protein